MNICLIHNIAISHECPLCAEEREDAERAAALRPWTRAAAAKDPAGAATRIAVLEELVLKIGHKYASSEFWAGDAEQFGLTPEEDAVLQDLVATRPVPAGIL